MKTAAIIAEFNPFHNGHRSLIRKAREAGADRIIALMSGCYVQRGEPAVADMSVRTQAALLGGADLVLVSPVRVSTASAESYAEGSIAILNALGVVDELVFGSESGDIRKLTQTAAVLADEDETFKIKLKEGLRAGMGFPAARAEAAGDTERILFLPNNILAVEYLKALLRSGSGIKAVTFPRTGSDHLGRHELAAVPSASGLRKAILSVSEKTHCPGGDPEWKERISPGMPPEAEEVLKRYFENEPPMTGRRLVPVLAAELFSHEDPEALTVYEDVDGDLARCMLRERGRLSGWEEFARLLASRAYPESRVRRAMLHTALKIQKRKRPGLYVRLTGFRESCTGLVSGIRRRSAVPVLVSPGRESALLTKEVHEVFAEDLSAENLYRWLLFESGGSFFRDIRHDHVIKLAL